MAHLLPLQGLRQAITISKLCTPAKGSTQYQTAIPRQARKGREADTHRVEVHIAVVHYRHKIKTDLGNEGRGRGTDEPTTDEGRGQTPNKGTTRQPGNSTGHSSCPGKDSSNKQAEAQGRATPAQTKRRKKTEGRGRRGGKPPKGNEPHRTQAQKRQLKSSSSLRASVKTVEASGKTHCRVH